MKRGIRAVIFMLALCFMIQCTTDAGSGSLAGPEADGTFTEAVKALEISLGGGYPVNGVEGARLAPNPGTKGPPSSISLSPMPSKLNTQEAYTAKRFTNTFCYNHPILIKPTPADATVTLAAPPQLELVGATGDVTEYASILYSIASHAWMLTGKKAGRVKLTVRTDNGKNASKVITITDDVILITSLSIYTSSSAAATDYAKTAKKTISVYHDIDASFRITAIGNPSSASFGGFTPGSRAVEFSSSKESVASTDLMGGSYGLIHPLSPGKATITCKATDGGRAKTTMKLTVKGGPVVAILMPDFALQIGATRKISPTIVPDEAWDRKLTWSSGNKRVATVDSKGNVKGIRPGTAVITCKNKSSGVRRSATVTVGYGKGATGATYRFFGHSFGAVHDYNSLVAVQNAFTHACSYTSAYSAPPTGMVKSDLVGRLQDLSTLYGITDQDVTILYFACEGKWVPDDPAHVALVCSDGVLTESEFQGYLEKVPGTVIVLLDSDLSGLFIKGKGVSPASREAQCKAFSQAWGKALSRSQADNFVAKSLSDTAAKAKFKVLCACGAKEPALTDPSARFKWFGFWLATGLGMTPDRTTGAPGTFSVANLRANQENPSQLVVTLDEAYAFTRHYIRLESTPAYRQSVSVWPSNDQTALFNMVS